MSRFAEAFRLLTVSTTQCTEASQEKQQHAIRVVHLLSNETHEEQVQVVSDDSSLQVNST